jgi:hypothetical protein
MLSAVLFMTPLSVAIHHGYDSAVKKLFSMRNRVLQDYSANLLEPDRLRLKHLLAPVVHDYADRCDTP